MGQQSREDENPFLIAVVELLVNNARSLYLYKMRMALKKKSAYLLLFFSIGAYAVVVFRNAWLAEDAFITFRTVDNFIHGYGLTWNVTERVQAYTNPLWMFIVSLFYFITREIFYTVTFLSIGISLLTVLVFTLWFHPLTRGAILGVIALMNSKAFIDYSTSGLENPLTHLILILFFWIYLQKEFKIHNLFWLSFIAALGTFNRMDSILLFLPALVYATWKVRSWKVLPAVIAGFAPFILWELFSLVYYGFLFPNTAYAKLDTGIPASELVVQGLYYLHDFR